MTTIIVINFILAAAVFSAVVGGLARSILQPSQAEPRFVRVRAPRDQAARAAWSRSVAEGI